MFRAENGGYSLIKKGDVVCCAGNYYINEKFNFNHQEKIITVGIFGYNQDVINYFRKNNWNTDRAERFFKNCNLEQSILLSATHGIDKLLDALYHALIYDDGLATYSISIEIFRHCIERLTKTPHKKIKAYSELQANSIIDLKNFLDENLDIYYPMPKLAKMFNISLSSMQRNFVEYYNMSPYQYHLHKRLEKAYHLIVHTDLKISSISESVGFSSYDNFLRLTKKYTVVGHLSTEK